MAAQYFAGRFSQLLSNTSVVNTVVPSFAGITSAVANANGSITAGWALATANGAATPVRYEIFIAVGSVTASALFVIANRRAIAKASETSYDLFETGLTSLLVSGQIYTLGVRAVSSVNITETNTVILTATSQGVPATSTNNLLNQIIATLGTPANATIAADIAEVEAETDGIASIPTNPLLTNDSRLNNLANLDATVSSRAATADTRFAHLDADVSTRAATADSRFTNLDATISSRAATADSRFAFLDVAVSTRATAAAVASIPTNPLLTNDARLNNLDATISSRAATADSRFAFLDASITSRASQTSVSQIQNNTLSAFVVPDIMVIPDSGSTIYNIYAYFYNETGAPRDPDSQIVNLTIKDSGGAILSGPTAMTRSGLGIYVSSTSVASTAVERTEYFFFDFSVSSVALEQVRISEVSLYQSGIDTLLGRLTQTRANNLDNLDATVSSRASASNLALVPTNPLLTNDARVAHLDADVSSRVATADSRLSHLDADISSRAATADSRFAFLDASVASRATQVSVNTLQTGVTAIPTNPLLANDSRLNFIDASIASRAATADSRFAFLDASLSSRASQSTLDSYFGNMSALAGNLSTVQTNLTTVQTALSADVVTLDGDISQVSTAANTANDAANTAAAAAADLTTGIAQLNSDIAGLETATAKIEKDAQVFATSNLTGAVTEEDALIGVVGGA